MFDESELELIDYLNIIYLKNELLTLPTSKLLEKYQAEEMYGIFLDTVNIMNAVDSAFLLFSNQALKKIETVVDTYRFLYRSAEFNIVRNDIIRYLNTVSSCSRELKNIKKDCYLDYHQDLRKMSFMTEDDFLYAVSYDAVSLYKLQDRNLQDMDDTCFLGSINYFIEVIPELFYEKDIQEVAQSKIEEISRRRGYRNRVVREFSQETMNHFQKIKK